jgi:hypothetical protein
MGAVFEPNKMSDLTTLRNKLIDKIPNADGFVIIAFPVVFGINATNPPREEQLLERSGTILVLAMLQLPVHLYFVIALRAVNQPLLEGGSENSWGFGQVVAIIMLGGTLLECYKGFSGKCMYTFFFLPWLPGSFIITMINSFAKLIPQSRILGLEAFVTSYTGTG